VIMLFFSLNCISQNTQESTNTIMGTLNASGNNASGSSGSVTYSIGQVFYTYIGASVYNVAQGVQQQESSQSLTVPEPIETPSVEVLIYPNPTTDYVNINMTGYEFGSQQGSFKLYDYQGRLLKQNAINQAETQVDLNDLSSSIYILQVFADNQVLKTFKIVKK
jgi:hypothetical protein